MTTEPDRIRADIEQTRAELSSDVDALGEKVAPRQVIRRRTQRVREMFGTAREKVMGTPAERTSQLRGQATDATDRMRGQATDATDRMRGQASESAEKVSSTASSAASTMSDAAAEAPRIARERIEGNPLAAGVVAFGVGWLVSSMIKPSEPEQRMARQAKDQIGQQAEPAVEEAKGAARDAAEHMREPAKEAAESVRSSAQDAPGAVKDEGRSAAREMRSS